MAQQFATGAVHIWVRSGGRGGGYQPGGPAPTLLPRYFGTCESMPEDKRMPEYESVMTDTTGTKIPYDVAFQGQSAQISLVMTRVEQDVVEDLVTLPNPRLGNTGFWKFSDVGTMMASENITWEIWLAYSFGKALADKKAYGNVVGINRFRPGRHYLQCVLWAPQSEDAGSKVMKQSFLFYSWPKANRAQRIFTLYDYDFTGINIQSIG